jgi:hypothetical protein
MVVVDLDSRYLIPLAKVLSKSEILCLITKLIDYTYTYETLDFIVSQCRYSNSDVIDSILPVIDGLNTTLTDYDIDITNLSPYDLVGDKLILIRKG